MPQNNNSERRKYKRQKVNVPVACKVISPPHGMPLIDVKDFDGDMVNISRGGAGILTEAYLPLETQVSATTKLKLLTGDKAHEKDDIVLKGEVRSCTKNWDNRYNISLFFGKLDPQSWRALNDYLLAASA